LTSWEYGTVKKNPGWSTHSSIGSVGGTVIIGEGCADGCNDECADGYSDETTEGCFESFSACPEGFTDVDGCPDGCVEGEEEG